MTSFGRLELRKDHSLSKGTTKFGMSERMRTLCCLVGQSVVYQEASELIAAMMGLELCAPQIQRVCTHYGHTVDALIKANCKSVIPHLGPGKAQDKLYVMIDGSMVFTRDDGWRELKLGRLFYDSQVFNIQANRKEVMKSVYVSHLGSVEEFFPKFERHLVGYTEKVVIGDGAKWIWNWADDNYPGAIQILDFYHAKEKLVLFARAQYRDQQTRLNWIEQQAEKLLDNGLEQVLLTLRACRARNPEAKLAKQKAIDYYI